MLFSGVGRVVVAMALTLGAVVGESAPTSAVPLEGADPATVAVEEPLVVEEPLGTASGSSSGPFQSFEVEGSSVYEPPAVEGLEVVVTADTPGDIFEESDSHEHGEADHEHGEADVDVKESSAAGLSGPGYQTFTHIDGMGDTFSLRIAGSVPAGARSDIEFARQRISALTGAAIHYGPAPTGATSIGDIVVEVSGSSPCNSTPGWIGCAVTQGSAGKAVGGLVTLHPNALYNNYQRPVILHELGHVFGLNHWDGVFSDGHQVMRSAVPPGLGDYKAGDRNGLAALGARRQHIPPPSRPQGSLDSVEASFESVRVTGWAVDGSNPPKTARIGISVAGRHHQAFANLYRSDLKALGHSGYQGFNVVVKAPPGTHNVCVSATSPKSNLTTQLGCRTVTVRSASPFGSIDLVESLPGKVRVAGWTMDGDTTGSLNVHIYVGGRGVANIVASAPRPDLQRHYPSRGAAHGFDATVNVGVAGDQPVCVYAINRGAGGNTLLGCRNIVAVSGSPVGVVAARPAGPGGVTVSGWMLDPDTEEAIDAHIYIYGSPGRKLLASRAVTADSAVSLPSNRRPWGPAHGLSATFEGLTGGRVEACVFGIDKAGGHANKLLSCSTVSLPTGAPNGSVDLATQVPGGVRVAGWTFDPDSTNPIPAHIYVYRGSRVVASQAVAADGSRPDIARVFPGYGDRHGFDTTVDVPGAGDVRVCVFGIDVVGGHANRLLRCAPTQVGSGSPTGAVSTRSGGPGTVAVSGWMLDPDTEEAIDAHIYLYGGPHRSLLASRAVKADGAASLPASWRPWGSGHGFSHVFEDVPGGRVEACVFGIDKEGGHANRLLSCSTVSLPTGAPNGSVDLVTQVSGGVRVAGWAFDPDSKNPIPVHVYVLRNGKTVASKAFAADGFRPDIARVFLGYGDRHGFDATVDVAGSGPVEVCVFGIDVAGGQPNRLLRCTPLRLSN